jgi:hypothetical protein
MRYVILEVHRKNSRAPHAAGRRQHEYRYVAMFMFMSIDGKAHRDTALVGSYSCKIVDRDTSWPDNTCREASNIEAERA